MKHKRLLITLTLGLGSLVGSWWVCVGMARPVSSQHPPALEDPCFSPATARQPIGAASAGGVLSDSAFLSTAILGPIKDNTLYERYEDSSSGAGAYLKAGIKCPDTRRRGVIAFDVAGGVPAGSR